MSRRHARKIRASKAPAKKPESTAAAPFRAAGGGATIRAADGDGKKLPTFEGVAYTGAPMTPEGWWTPIVCELDGFKIPSQTRPVLRQHDHTKIVGHTESVKVTADGLTIAGPLSGVGPDKDEVVGLAGNGFRWQLSIGANPVRTSFLEAGETATVNGREVTGPLTISHETELGEISFVPLGADGDTSATVSASKGGIMNWKNALRAAVELMKAAEYSDEQIDRMTEEEAKAALKECVADDGPDAADDEAKAKAKAEEDEKAKAADEKDEEKKAEARAQARIAAARKAEADEARRCDAIRATAKKYGVTTVEHGGRPVPFVAHAIEQGWSADKAELEALRTARPTADAGPTVYVTNRPELNEAVIEAAVLHANRHSFRLEDDSFYVEPTPDGKGSVRRVPKYVQAEAQRDFRERYTDQVQQAAHTLFRGQIGFQQLFQLAFRANGSSASLDLNSEPGIRSMMAEWDFAERSRLRAEGASNLSISNILSNVQNKFALQGYLFTEQAWREFCAVRPVKDFKPTKSINLLGSTMFKQIGPSGELENFSLGDQAFSNQANNYGIIGTIPWTHLVNDDLTILGTVPMKVGQGAGLALNDAIWTLWKNMAAGTVNGDDGNPFWRTTSLTTKAAMQAGTAYKPNKTSGAGSALSAAALQAVKALFDNQIDPNGNPLGFDGVTPILLHGPSNWQTVAQLLYANSIVYGGATASMQPNYNAWQGMMKPVMSRYVENANYVNSTTAYWVLFNPVALAVIEVCFLNGIDTPSVLQAGPDYQFDRLGISIRGTMPFGANQQNFRGGVYAVGA